MTKHTILLQKGAVTGTDPSMLGEGELQQAIGVSYMPSNPAVMKVGGRALFNSAAIASAAVNGLSYVSFDGTSTDYVLAQVSGTLYKAVPGVATFSSARTGLTASAQSVNGRKSDTDQFFMCNGVDANWVMKNDGTTILHGLTAQTVAPTSAFVGGALTGTYVYWCTEFDSTNSIESAATSAATLTVSPSAQNVTITKPATVNSSATHWRLYRTKTGGAFPIGWLVATTVIGTTTYTDSTTDANLVLAAPFAITSIQSTASGILATVSEPQNLPPPVFRSLEFYAGSLCGVAGRSLYYSEAGVYHYFPASYAMPFKPTFGGQARCVRRIGGILLVFFDHETFRVNYLPRSADSLFDVGEAQERIGRYGTPSPLGAVVFSGWGGREMCLIAARTTLMLTDGHSFDQAVKNIDWENLIPPANLSTCVLVDDSDELRCILYYNDAAADATSWSKLHIYYDATRIGYSVGFPELAWTGPHKCPGPGIVGVTNNVPQEYAGSRKADGYVYKEETGVSDAANLTDSSGTVPWSITTPRLYPKGPGGGATCKRVYIHKTGTGTGSYACTLTAYNDGSPNQPVTITKNIDATQGGLTSEDFMAAGQSFAFQITRNDALSMPPINSLTLTFDDEAEEWSKTNVQTV